MVDFLRKAAKPKHVHIAYLLKSTALNIKHLFYRGFYSSIQLGTPKSIRKCYFATCALYKTVMTVCHSLLSANNQTGQLLC